MKLSNLLKAMTPSLAKDELLEGIRGAHDLTKNIAQEAYRTAATYMANWDFKSQDMASFENTFVKLVHRRKGNFITTIAQALAQSVENLRYIETEVIKRFDEVTTTTALTFRHSQVLQYIEQATFVANYSLLLLNLVYVAETIAVNGGTEQIDAEITPVEYRYIKENEIGFCEALNNMLLSVSDVQKAIDGSPDVTITETNITAMSATATAGKVMPFSSGFIDARWNPFFYIGQWWANRWIARYKAAREELRMLQLRRHHLERVVDKKPSPQLEKEIQMIRSRVEELRFKIDKMEGSVS